MREGVLRLRHADWQRAIAELLEARQALGCCRRNVNPVRAIDTHGDRLDLLCERDVVGIDRRVSRLTRVGGGPHGLSEFRGAGAAVGEVGRDNRIACPCCTCDALDRLMFCCRIGWECIDRHDGWHTERTNVFNLLREVFCTALNGIDVLDA